MKTISSPLAAHIAGEVTTLATCWKLTRRDATVLGFTDHDRDLSIGGVTYQAATGFTPTAIASSSTFSVDNLEAEGMLSASSIAEPDILAGKYDFAEIEIFKVNYADLSQGTLKLRRGWLGEVSLSRGHFVVEVRGMMQRLSQTIGEIYSPSCRATFGDARCTVNLAPHTVTGSITTAASAQEFVDSARSEASGIFTVGKVTFTSGNNNGLAMEIKEHIFTTGAGGRFTLALPMPYALAAGVTYSMIRGCDKTINTCITFYNNAMNFRGEPHVPGLDRMLETAGTRSSW